MGFLTNIRTVAKYESKLLTRSWFFRIFAVLAMGFLSLFTGVLLLGDDSGNTWTFKAIPSNMGYIALLFLNTGQAVIAIFLASDFLKRDKKLDTSEVFYVHPLSNAEYVFGKIWGNLRVFLMLDFVVAGMVMVFNILAKDMDMDWPAYIIYIAVICIPTLVYITGLSVLLMLVVRNQALTFVLLLGYIGLTLFYVGDKFYYLFDYMVYSLPLVKSGIVGFSNWDAILNHRAIYFFAGLSFICFTISLFNRLPNSSRSSYPWVGIGIALLSVAGMSGYNHVHSFVHSGEVRQRFIELNNQYARTPKMVIGSYDLKLSQQPGRVTVDARLTGRPLATASTFTFCLNPGFDTDGDITEDGRPLKWTRERQILRIDFGRELTPADTVTFHIRYGGRPDGNLSYLDIPDEVLHKNHTVNQMFNVDKQYSFQTDDYLLLTPENYWYPVPGTAYSSESPDWRQTYFSRFTLEVTPLPGLVPVSQGECTERDGVYTFRPEHPSPAIPLVIGRYKQVELTADSTRYSVWYIAGHDYFIAPFDSIRDTIPTLIRNIRENLERTYKLDYSFPRFSLVEVPAQFFSYQRAWSQAQETIQPEMALFPEKGWLYDQMDVNKRIGRHIGWARNSGHEITKKEAAQRAMNDILTIFTRMEGGSNYSDAGRGGMEITINSNPYFLFPQLYNYRYNFFSPEWPVANRLIELYLQDRTPNEDRERNINGLSSNEKANQLTERYSFRELLAGVEHRDIMDNIIGMRGRQLFARAEYNTGVAAFRDSLYALLKRNEFRNVQFEQLLDTLGRIGGVDIRQGIAGWDSIIPLPYYSISQPEVTRYRNRGQELYVLKLGISNNSEADGIVNVRLQVGGRQAQGDDTDPRLNRQVPLRAREAKQLVSIWDDAPRNVSIHTLLSQNLPNNIQLPIRNINREPGRPGDVEGDYPLAASTFALAGEVIVDNEDSTLFSLSQPDMVGLLPQWLDKVEESSFKYRGIPWWRPPLQWTPTTNAGYYGQYIRSACVIKSGNGRQTATWKAPLPSPGHYEVYYWTYGTTQRGRGGRDGDGEYHFKVRYDDEEEDAFLNMRRVEDGWNMLGVYYVNSDTIQITLTNDSKLRTVTADAVRVVKR